MGVGTSTVFSRPCIKRGYIQVRRCFFHTFFVRLYESQVFVYWFFIGPSLEIFRNTIVDINLLGCIASAASIVLFCTFLFCTCVIPVMNL